MKPPHTNNHGNDVGRLLILSDGKPGHVNQSIAFARHMSADFDLLPVSFRFNWLKGFSYIADRMGLYSTLFFSQRATETGYDAIVSAGSGTYYINKVLAKKLECRSVAIMLPKGYRLDFDLIVAQLHDNPPEQDNIINLPVNLSYIEPQGLVVARENARYVSVVVGGSSSHNTMDIGRLREQIKNIRVLFPEHLYLLTTSRRTSIEVEEMLRDFDWDRAVFYSSEQINPVPDFLSFSDYVFITADSSSMISEAVSYGGACVEVLPLSKGLSPGGKLGRLIDVLAESGCLHLFDNSVGRCRQKISLTDALSGVNF